MKNTPGIKERFDNPGEQQRGAIENELTNARFAIPGIIVSFNEGNQTASVQPAITENVQIGSADKQAMNLPVLSDVPVQFPRGGGFCLTFPVKEGDECLLIFGDMCIDGWWQSSGVQDQMEKRRHDLSDAMAILGISSAPKAISDISMSSIMLRNESKSTYIEIESGGNINMVAPTVNVTGDVKISGSLEVAVEATIAGIAFTPHVHGGVTAGGDDTQQPK